MKYAMIGSGSLGSRERNVVRAERLEPSRAV